MPGVDVKDNGCGPTHFAACQCREDHFRTLEAKLEKAKAALVSLDNKLNTISVRANTYGPTFPVTYADALYRLAAEARNALKEINDGKL